jgi:hypothetical protein
METTPLATSPAPASSKRLAAITQGLLVGGSFAGGGTVIFSAIELIRSEPDKAFRLLESWGPWFFLALFTAYTLRELVNRLLDLGERFGDRVANALDNVAAEQKVAALAMRDQAAAIQQSAEKDDRNLQEMQTLTALTAQRSEKTYAMLQAYHEDNQKILLRIEEKVDTKIAASEKDGA